MRKFIVFIFLFFVTFYSSYLVYGEEPQDQSSQEVIQESAEVQAAEANPSILDKASDWWATLGKSEEEKAQILEERRLQRLGQASQPAIEQMKTQARDKAIVVKEELKNKAALMKEQAHQNFSGAKEKAGQKIAETKQQVKQKINDTKASASSNIETKKQQIKQESEKTFKGFMEGLFK